MDFEIEWVMVVAAVAVELVVGLLLRLQRLLRPYYLVVGSIDSIAKFSEGIAALVVRDTLRSAVRGHAETEA